MNQQDDKTIELLNEIALFFRKEQIKCAKLATPDMPLEDRVVNSSYASCHQGTVAFIDAITSSMNQGDTVEDIIESIKDL